MRFIRRLITPEASNQDAGKGCLAHKCRETGAFRENFNNFRPLWWTKANRWTAWQVVDRINLFLKDRLLAEAG